MTNKAKASKTIYMLVGVVAVLVLGATAFTYFTGQRMVALRVPLADAAMELELELAMGHLTVEEILTGGRKEPVERVWRHIDRAEWFARAMLEGGEGPASRIMPLVDAVARQDVSWILERIGEYRGMTKARLDNHETNKSGSALDEAEDKLFDEILGCARTVEARIRGRTNAELETFRLVQGSLLVLLLVFAVVVAMVLQRFERRRQADYAEVSRARQAAESKERWLSSTLESMGDEVFITAPDGIVSYANPAAVEFVGKAEDEVIGAGIAQLVRFVDEESGEERENPVARVIRERLVLSRSTRYAVEDPTGGLRPVAVTAAPIRNQDELIGVVLIFKDISERKRAELERREFEQRIQRTQKLESLGVLAGGIAHDFNNLLVGMLGNAQLVRDDLPPDSVALESLAQVELAARRAADLTRQMLAYSGGGRFVVEPVDLSVLVLETGQLLQSAMSGGTRIDYALCDDVPAVAGDATQLGQIVMNLITNAAEAIGDEGGRIVLSTGAVELAEGRRGTAVFGTDLADGTYIYLEVSDSGTGIEREVLEKIFEPFFTTKFTGRGLGLAAVLGIVQGHQGALVVQSSPGDGSTFRVLLPPANQEPSRVEPAEGSAEVSSQTGRVLVVDDLEPVRNLVQTALERAGFTVTLAEDGVAALRLFGDAPDSFDLALLDLTMPKKGGLAVLEELRAQRPDFPVVLSSGYEEKAALSEHARGGWAAFIQKPYLPSDLVAVLSNVLRRSRRAERAPQQGRSARRLGAGLAALLCMGAQQAGTPSAGVDCRVTVPAGLPSEIPAPPDNPMRAEHFELGRRLFFDSRLSVDRHAPYASCHDPARGPSSAVARPPGSLGRRALRNAPSLYNLETEGRSHQEGHSLREDHRGDRREGRGGLARRRGRDKRARSPQRGRALRPACAVRDRGGRSIFARLALPSRSRTVRSRPLKTSVTAQPSLSGQYSPAPTVQQPNESGPSRASMISRRLIRAGGLPSE